VGFAQLDMNGAYSNLLFLNKENYSLFWEDFTKREDLQVSGSQEYDAFIQGMKTFQEAEAKLAGWHYLLPLYKKDSLKQYQITSELDRVNNLFPSYVKSLPEDVWVRQYLLTKGLIEQMPISVKTYSWRAPQHVTEFMAIDFQVMMHSGLLKQVIEGYSYLVERFPMEEVAPLLNQAIDKVIVELKDEPSIQQEAAQHWFTFLESHSLFGAAEYLALKMLNDESCILDEKSTNLFEQYRKMAKGKIVPNIDLNVEGSPAKDLKSIAAQYKLVVFGASWCPTCKEDYSKLKEKYAGLKANKDVEIVYISIDTDKDAFEAYYGDAPFITFCDGKGWESEAVTDYHIFATPSYFLLDNELNILEKIKTIEHLESWLARK
jgi:thiol-disulfide isomerase/thioredoxin